MWAQALAKAGLCHPLPEPWVSSCPYHDRIIYRQGGRRGGAEGGKGANARLHGTLPWGRMGILQSAPTETTSYIGCLAITAYPDIWPSCKQPAGGHTHAPHAHPPSCTQLAGGHL